MGIVETRVVDVRGLQPRGIRQKVGLQRNCEILSISEEKLITNESCYRVEKSSAESLALAPGIRG